MRPTLAILGYTSSGIRRIASTAFCMTWGLALLGIPGSVSGQPVDGPRPSPGWEFRAPALRTSNLRVLVIYDMEGIAGIDRREMTTCLPDSAAYRRGREQLVYDVNSVIDGLVAAGAAEVGVIDRHGACTEVQIDLPADRLDKRARFVDESKGSALDQPWDAVALVGMHAGPGADAFLEHTGSMGIERILNGLSVTESENLALRLGENGIPVIFASGDDRLRDHLARRMPWVTYVEVKRSVSRTSAALRPLAEARAELRARASDALRQRERARTLALVPPFTGAFRPVYPETVDWLAAIPGLDVKDGFIRVSASSARELNQAISRVQGAVSQHWWAEMFWEAAKVHPDIVARADSAFYARWVAGPPVAKTRPNQDD